MLKPSVLEAEHVPKGQKRLTAGNCFPLDASGRRSWVLGSDSQDSDIVIEAAFVDRRHAKLEVFSGTVSGRVCWEICDLGSENGTFLNGVRISRSRLERCDPSTCLCLANCVCVCDISFMLVALALTGVRMQIPQQ